MSASIFWDWKPAEETIYDKETIIEEALRYCPEFQEIAFKPEPEKTEVSIKEVSFYEDYQLVRLTPASDSDNASSPRKEVYGFYAPGDFRPLDRPGRAIEKLNKVAPIQLTKDTVLDYTLLRLRFELHHILNESSIREKDESSIKENGLELAEIITEQSDLLVEENELNQEQWLKSTSLLIKPQAEENEQSSRDIEQGAKHHIKASAILYHESKWELVKVSVEVASDGKLEMASKGTERSDRFSIGKNVPSKPLVFSPPRTRTAMPIREWYMLRKGKQKSDTLPEALNKKVKIEAEFLFKVLDENCGVGEKDKIILRIADLTFYKTYFLLEILIKKENEAYKRSYALIRQFKESMKIHPLNGTSPVLYQINKEENEISINKDTANNYLRFFGWAVHGEEGPFYLPHHLREIPFSSAPADQIKKIKGYIPEKTGEFPIESIDDKEAKDHGYPLEASMEKKKAYIFYATAMFEAWFGIEPKGMVNMFDDQPQEVDLAIDNERYGKGDLFRLNLKKTSSERPQDIEGDSDRKGDGKKLQQGADTTEDDHVSKRSKKKPTTSDISADHTEEVSPLPEGPKATSSERPNPRHYLEDRLSNKSNEQNDPIGTAENGGKDAGKPEFKDGADKEPIDPKSQQLNFREKLLKDGMVSNYPITEPITFDNDYFDKKSNEKTS